MANKKYSDLNEDEKKYFKDICDKNFGETNCFAKPSGEPLYFTEDALMVPTQQIVDLLFNTNDN